MCNPSDGSPIALQSQYFILRAMGKWTVDDLVKEIKDLEALYQLRGASPIVEQFQQGLVTKIKAIEIAPAHVLTLSETTSKTSLPEDIKDVINDAMDQQAMSGAAGPLTLTTRPQHLVAVFNYMSVAEADTLKACTQTDGIALVVGRLKKIGVKSLKETTKKATAAYMVLLSLQRGQARPPPEEFYRLCGFVASSFHACSEMPLVSGYANYPNSPAELGKDFWRCMAKFCFAKKNAIE